MHAKSHSCYVDLPRQWAARKCVALSVAFSFHGQHTFSQSWLPSACCGDLSHGENIVLDYNWNLWKPVKILHITDNFIRNIFVHQCSEQNYSFSYDCMVWLIAGIHRFAPGLKDQMHLLHVLQLEKGWAVLTIHDIKKAFPNIKDLVGCSIYVKASVLTSTGKKVWS